MRNPEAIELLEQGGPEYVVDIVGLPAILVGNDSNHLREDLGRTASLAVKGRRSVRAASVDLPPHGIHLAATLRFPRIENIQIDEGFLLFSAKTRSAQIEQRFKLKSMMYRGKLSL